jgi:2-polyprenyl-3-methyl-5-hydroxy-6-metoxy-1,4-benzoquinol methylase
MTENELIENHHRFSERVALYRKYGYDIEKERSFIIEKALPISGKILEAGTGKGYFTLAFARGGFYFTSFDISAAEQKYAKLNLTYHGLEQQVHFDVADAECLPYEGVFFDVIFAVNMIHHLSSVRKLCDELVRVFSPFGKIVISDLNIQGLAIMDKVHALDGRQHEVSAGTLNEVNVILIECGFKLEEHHSTTQDMLVAYRTII